MIFYTRSSGFDETITDEPGGEDREGGEFKLELSGLSCRISVEHFTPNGDGAAADFDALPHIVEATVLITVITMNANT